jgi:hypothetical protein
VEIIRARTLNWIAMASRRKKKTANAEMINKMIKILLFY